MTSAKKVKRKSKPPARLKEFLCEENIEKGHEPRRSRRTPKLSEKLQRYLNDKGGVVKDQNNEGDSQTTVSSEHSLLGSKYTEPKVVLKALPKSLLQKGTKKYPIYKKEPRVTLKRLGSGVGNKKGGRMLTSKLHKHKSGLRKTVSASSSSQAPVSKKELKVELVDISTTAEKQQAKRSKRKRVSDESEVRPEKKSNRSLRGSEIKVENENKEEKEYRFDPDILQNLFDFGSKVEEALSLNAEAIKKLTKHKDKRQSLTDIVGDGVEDFNESDITKVLNWLEEEERQRKEHREKMLESLRVSHNTNIALYSRMLTVLQSVTASV